MISIYVGNLTYNVTEDELREYFQQHGEVQRIHLVTDRETGRPRGFGFVEMDDDGGRAAIEALNGKDFQGRPLTINEARPREERGGGGGGGYRGGGGGGGGGGYRGGGGGGGGGGYGGGGGGGGGYGSGSGDPGGGGGGMFEKDSGRRGRDRGTRRNDW
jgi:RNA recognition motif-containing protein